MSINEQISQLSPEVIERFKMAIETGRWPNGERLTDKQREICMEAIVVWDLQHLPPEDRVGFIDRGSKAEGENCDSPEHSHADGLIEQPFQIRHKS